MGDLVLDDGERRILLPRGHASRVRPFAINSLSIAFSVLNALAAVVYEDGLIQVFNLRQTMADCAQVLATVMVLPERQMVEAAIRFDGFGQVHTIFSYLTDHGPRLDEHILYLGQHASA